jgi:hypothetical protein
MIKLINEINTITGSLFPIKEKYKSQKFEIKKNFFINVYGNLKNATRTMICLHGAGSDRFSNHIIHFCNEYIDELDENKACFITFDMPGVGENINNKKFWGAQCNSIDINLDLIIEFILKKNKKTNIFISSISASSAQVLAYMTDNGKIVRNKFKNNVKHYYFISPTGEIDETLDWIFKFSIYSKFISISHSIKQLRFIIKKFKYIKLIDLFKNFLNIKNTNYIFDKEKYHFNFNAKIKNCDVILSKNDPITNYEIVISFLNLFDKFNIIEYNSGGHVGFFDITFKKRKHELYILNSIKKLC